jgi:uncharacterized protein
MRVVITGGTGFIGRAVVQTLVAAKHSCTILSRHPAPPQPLCTTVVWDAVNGGDWESVVDGADAIVNLAGEGVATRRWTDAQKTRMRESRVMATTALVMAIARATQKPHTLMNASGIGYYGDGGEALLTEAAAAGSDFLAEMALHWEQSAQIAETHGVRVVRLRLGLVLGRGGGFLARMLPLFRWGLGGVVGTGQQWMSWIHLDDLIAMLLFLLQPDMLRGAVNATAPHPVRNRELTRTLGRVLHRPTYLWTPAPLLRWVLGEQAILALVSQRVSPQRITTAGYQFQFPDLESALRNIVGRE